MTGFIACREQSHTKRFRRILNAWHFQFDSPLVATAQWFRLGGRVVHYLTRRYKFLYLKGLNIFGSSSLQLWQLSRQFAIVLRFGWKERVSSLLGRVSSLGREVELQV